MFEVRVAALSVHVLASWPFNRALTLELYITFFLSYIPVIRSDLMTLTFELWSFKCDSLACVIFSGANISTKLVFVSYGALLAWWAFWVINLHMTMPFDLFTSKWRTSYACHWEWCKKIELFMPMTLCASVRNPKGIGLHGHRYVDLWVTLTLSLSSPKPGETVWCTVRPLFGRLHWI